MRVWLGAALVASAALVAGCDGESSGDAGPLGPDASPDDGGAVDPDAGRPLPVDGGVVSIPEGEVFETFGRLSVADRDEAAVTVWDLDVRGPMTSYALTAPARLYGASSRQITAGVAAQPIAGRFDVYAVGVWVWDHVDHFHVYKDPAVVQVDEALTHTGGLTDVHVNGGWIVAFDDATGRTTALLERSIGPLRSDVDRSRAPIFRTVEGAPHDGLAVVARGQLFATQADGGVRRYPQTADGFGDPVELACPAPGAGGAAGFRAVFDCEADLLVSRWDEAAEAFEDVRVPRPAGVDRPSRFVGERDLPTLVGLAGASELILVDPAAATASAVSLEAPVVDLASDRDGERLLVLLEGGVLLDLDPVSGAERRRLVLDATGPLVDLAPGDGRAYLAEPDAGLVHEVDLETFEALDPLAVGGAPASLVVTAMWPGGEPVRH